jgi:hypothetical protein
MCFMFDFVILKVKFKNYDFKKNVVKHLKKITVWLLKL